MSETIPFLQETIEAAKIILSPDTVKVALAILREQIVIELLNIL